ncbi:MAG: hypothetical protein IJQ47_00265 [Synergistaceae bacterium]|nr:hypothetical protein [Synergistaceae bacterium]
MIYQKPIIKTIDLNELKKIIFANAYSDTTNCLDVPLFDCSIAAFSYCPSYDAEHCDPFSAPTGSHGNYPGNVGNIPL